MTKKHFEELARQISQIGDLKTRREACLVVAEACRKFNPKFDARRFALACNVIKGE